jgi:hypothetical protein
MRIMFVALFGTLSIAATEFPAFAQSTTCVLVQPCPIDYCPYMKTDNVPLKIQTYQKACQEYSESQGFKALGLIADAYPKCKSLMTLEGKVDCPHLQ